MNSSTQMSSCSICCEKFNKSKRRRIACSCGYEQCSICAETYLTGIIDDAHCMNCRRAWDMDFLQKNFTAVFLTKTYKKHRMRIMFERERSRFPETMPFVEKQLYMKRLGEWIQKKQSEVVTEYSDITRMRSITQMHNFNFHSLYLIEAQHLQNQLRVIENGVKFRAIRFARGYLTELKNDREMFPDETLDIYFERIMQVDLTSASINNGAAVVAENCGAVAAAAAAASRKRFVRACSANECRGFLSTAWKCGLCQCWTCPTCHEFIGPEKTDADGHLQACRPENVETARMLDRDSRPCPKCASLIFKISGCDQMFCTQCATAFNWKTGRTQDGAVHNPHYFEFMRLQNEAAANNTDAIQDATMQQQQQEHQGCLEMPSLRVINDRERILDIIDINDELKFFCRKKRIFRPKRLMTNILRLYNHLMHIDIPHFMPTNHEQNRDLRIKYMLNEINEEKFKQLIYSRDKRENIKNEMRFVFEMFANSCVDLVHRMLGGPDNTYGDLCREFVALHDYSSECLKTIAKRYNVSKKVIGLSDF